MGRWREDYAAVLEGAEYVKTLLAKNLLEEAGIPSLLYGADYGHAELGAVERSAFQRASLLVPRDALERAREILGDAWGELPS